MKRIFHLIVSLLLCLCILLIPAAGLTDFGDFSGDSDYGGSSDWSSSSYDDDDDDSYSGSYFSFNDSDGGGGGFSIGIIVVVFIVVAILYAVKKQTPAQRGSASLAGANTTARSTLKPMEGYQSLDPAFDAAAFRERLSNLYVQMQNCWQDKDISSLRPYFTDAYFTQMDRQLGALKRNGRTNYVERIAVLGVTLKGFYQGGGEDHIVAELKTRIVDYTLDDETGKLISGSNTKEKFMTYEWDLSRASGIVTGEKKAMEDVHCPNCGAPVFINTTAECPYCNSVITLSAHDWAICTIRGISQQTR